MDRSLAFSIREYKEPDYPAVASLWLITGLGNPMRGDDAATITRSLEMGGKFWVAETPGGRIAGTAWITYDGRRMHLHHVGVLPEYQRNGIGRALSVMAVNHAKEKNIQIKLEVHKDNLPAIALYKDLGFNYLGDYLVYIIRC